jgi:uncharacterized protein YjiS (DUF1127 family)
MRNSHDLSQRTLDLCIAAFYLGRGLGEGTPRNIKAAARRIASREAENSEKGLDMKLSFITRFLEERRRYWNVLHELSTYTDRELQDIGIDRADIHHIARQAARG